MCNGTGDTGLTVRLCGGGIAMLSRCAGVARPSELVSCLRVALAWHCTGGASALATSSPVSPQCACMRPRSTRRVGIVSVRCRKLGEGCTVRWQPQNSRWLPIRHANPGKQPAERRHPAWEAQPINHSLEREALGAKHYTARLRSMQTNSFVVIKAYSMVVVRPKSGSSGIRLQRAQIACSTVSGRKSDVEHPTE